MKKNFPSLKVPSLKKFYGNMDWWEVAEQPPHHSKIAQFFKECRSLWEDGGAKAEIARQRIQSHLRAKFLLENIRNFGEVFYVDKFRCLEVAALEVLLVDLDFSVSPIPLCKSEAYFSILVQDGFDTIDLEEWQSNNDPLYDAVSFYWEFGFDNADGRDYTFGNNSGVECICME